MKGLVWDLLSDDFHKTAVLKKKKRIVNLSFTAKVLTINGATPVPKLIRSLALDFPDIGLQFFMEILVGRKRKKIIKQHCIFSRGYLPVKMALTLTLTLTRNRDYRNDSI